MWASRLRPHNACSSTNKRSFFSLVRDGFLRKRAAVGLIFVRGEEMRKAGSAAQGAQWGRLAGSSCRILMFDRKDGALDAHQEILCHASEDQLAHRAAAPQPDDQE